MLRVGAVRFRGRCEKHPRYLPPEPPEDPNCKRCGLLADIERAHRRMVALMRQFRPEDWPAVRTEPDPRQPSLFPPENTETAA
jgi:hypothetical protein